MMAKSMDKFNRGKLNDKLEYSFQNNKDSNSDDDFLEISIHKVEKDSVADILSGFDRECSLLIHKWKAEQSFLKSRMTLEEDDNLLTNVKLIGGVDISFPSDKEDLVHASVCLVVLSYPELKVKYKKCKMVHLTSIYIPGYLAFREVEPIQLLCEELLRENKSLYPDIIFVDGNGILHPAKFGLACHLGVLLNIPTVGVAKKLFHVDGLEKNENIRTTLLMQKGDTFNLKELSDFVYGKALRSTSQSTNPIFVSIGNKISLDTAVQLVNQEGS